MRWHHLSTEPSHDSTGPNKVNMRLTSHMPNLSQQSLNPHHQITRGRTIAALLKKTILQVKSNLNNLLKDCLFLLLHKKYVNHIKMLNWKDQKSKYILEWFLGELFSHPESKLHPATSPLQKTDLLWQKKSEKYSDGSSQSASLGPD